MSLLALFLVACGPSKSGEVGDDTPRDTVTDATQDDTATSGGDTAADSGDTNDSGASDTGGDSASGDTGADTVTPVVYDPWPFIDRVVDYVPGAFAGFGQDGFPDVVYGPPEAPGNGGGALDVLSLGEGGSIVVAFRDLDLIDGPGPDLLVFENAFAGWPETGIVGVSEDGATWTEWPCAADDTAGGYPGCAGVAVVYANSTNGIDARDPEAAGGDAFDLADLGVTRARYVRVRDSGENNYAGVSGGFDLDAMAVVHGAAR